MAHHDFSQQGIEELAAALECCSQLKVLAWACKSGKKLGSAGGAAVAKVMKNCKQLTSVNLEGTTDVLCAMGGAMR